MKEFILTHSEKIGQPGQCHLVYERPNGGGYVGSIEPKEDGYLASFNYPVLSTNKIVTVEEAFEWLITQRVSTVEETTELLRKLANGEGAAQ